ncbi:MAG: cupin domain-containing protein [Candidatus Riflebacteria bacterium]|nr:cupin domain-containing protein [Candidatus Riflebacteria bacterium]
MLLKLDNYYSFTDDRGSLKGLINTGKWEEVNLVTSMKDSTRGNHYHKETIEVFIIIKGKIEVSLQKVENSRLSGSVEKHIFRKGDVFLINPFVNHTFFCIEESEWLNMLSKTINIENKDIFRVS